MGNASVDPVIAERGVGSDRPGIQQIGKLLVILLENRAVRFMLTLFVTEKL
jgi:hypothetical protein